MASIMTPEIGVGTTGPTITIRMRQVVFGQSFWTDCIIHPVVTRP
jgi:hypothetical protein